MQESQINEQRSEIAELRSRLFDLDDLKQEIEKIQSLLKTTQEYGTKK